MGFLGLAVIRVPKDSTSRFSWRHFSISSRDGELFAAAILAAGVLRPPVIHNGVGGFGQPAECRAHSLSFFVIDWVGSFP